MAFPTDWKRRCPLVIDHTIVTGDQTDFPVLFTAANLPSEILDADGEFKAGASGGDIRFSSDIAGATQLSCEVVKFVLDNNPANGIAEIWVKIPSLSASTDTTIYVWYGVSWAESQPAVDAAFGRNDVWSNNFVGVWHLGEVDGEVAIDSTGGGNDLTFGTSLPNPTAAKIGNGQLLDAASNGNNMVAPDQSVFVLPNNVTTSIWARWDSPGTTYDCLLIKDSCYGLQRSAETSPPKMCFLWNVGTGAPSYEFIESTSLLNADSNLHYWVGTHAAGVAGKIYCDGALENTGTLTAANNESTSPFEISHNSSAITFGWKGLVDEARVSSVERSSTWISTEFASQNNPGAFAHAGSPISLIRYINGASNRNAGSGTTLDAANSLICTAGCWMVVMTSAYLTGGAPNVSSVTDTAGNTYTKVGATYSGDSNHKMECWLGKIVTGSGTNLVTVTWASATTWRVMSATQYDGFDPSSPFMYDGSGELDGPSTSHTTTTVNVTSSIAVVISLGISWDTATGSFSAVAPYNARIAVTDYYATVDRLTYSTGTYSTTYTTGNSSTMAHIVMAFKAAANTTWLKKCYWWNKTTESSGVI